MEKTVNRFIKKRCICLAIAFTNNNMYTGLAWELSFALEQSFRYMSHPIQLTLLYAESIRA